MSGIDLTVVLVALAAGSLLKSITGMGMPIVAIPVISLFAGLAVPDAVAVVALPNLAVNGVLVVRERSGFAATGHLRPLLAAGVVGAVVGALVLVSVPEEPIVALLGVVVAGYTVVAVTSPDLTMSADRSRRYAPSVGFIGGLLQGAIGISGPIFGTWIHSHRLDRHAHVLSLVVIFFLTGSAQTLVIAATGGLDGLWLATLAGVPAAVVAIPAGVGLRDRLSVHHFDRLVLATLVASTATLVLRTFT